MPLTSNVIIDQARALDLLDQLRVAVPEEVRAAKRINEETERIVERAQEEAERILARAQEQAAFLIEERELTRAAEIKSKEIIAEGQREADEIRRGADEYAAERAGQDSKASWSSELQSIKRGLAMLDERYVDDERGQRRRTSGGGAHRCRWTRLATTSRRCCGRRRGQRQRYPVEDVQLDIADDLTLAEPINGEVRLSRTGRSVLARAHLTHGRSRATCSRCLKAVVAPIEVEIEEEALPSIDIDTGLPLDPRRGAGRAAA